MQQSPFFSFRRGFVTVLTMVTGDLGYQDAFGLSYDVVGSNVPQITSSILYPETANFVWVVFLVLIPILLTNMLVSITNNMLVSITYVIYYTCSILFKWTKINL